MVHISINEISASIKGHNAVVYKQIEPICNPKPLLKIGQKLLELRKSPEMKHRLTDWHSKFLEGMT